MAKKTIFPSGFLKLLQERDEEKRSYGKYYLISKNHLGSILIRGERREFLPRVPAPHSASVEKTHIDGGNVFSYFTKMFRGGVM